MTQFITCTVKGQRFAEDRHSVVPQEERFLTNQLSPAREQLVLHKLPFYFRTSDQLFKNSCFILSFEEGSLHIYIIIFGREIWIVVKKSEFILSAPRIGRVSMALLQKRARWSILQHKEQCNVMIPSVTPCAEFWSTSHLSVDLNLVILRFNCKLIRISYFAEL